MAYKNQSVVIFDYDGTLHNSIVLYKPAFLKAFAYLVERAPKAVLQAGYQLDQEWTDHAISQWLGYSKNEMWANFMPELELSLKEACGKIIGDEMDRLSLEGYGQLYEGAIETLAYLKDKGYKLIFLSNCSRAYMDRHCDLFNLDEYFHVLACAGQYPTLKKSEILKVLLEETGLSLNEGYQHYMVGDREQDFELARFHHINMIGCDYGFGRPGELEDVAVHIASIKELKSLL